MQDVIKKAPIEGHPKPSVRDQRKPFIRLKIYHVRADHAVEQIHSDIGKK
ncbi:MULTISPECIES: hypothetical protein [unclassified Paenibacillus]|nr:MULTISPECIES: hypothetical protein [unclassified Paenibacillus]MCM3342202.1 hypothetical protein [Paenibacillus sp. MER TA 81-3]